MKEKRGNKFFDGGSREILEQNVFNQFIKASQFGGTFFIRWCSKGSSLFETIVNSTVLFAEAMCRASVAHIKFNIVDVSS